MESYHTIETPKGAPGAIAMIRVVHPDPESIGLVNPKLHAVRYAKVYEIDEGVVTRWDTDSIVLMAHGGIAIVRAISAALESRGVRLVDGGGDGEGAFPEADSEIESRMLAYVSKAASPLAVNLLLDQPDAWRSVGVESLEQAQKYEDVCDGAARLRLIEPPIVVAVGRANIGKSTLINALAGEHVAIVADIAGTTRDHVGVLVDLAGLVVRWIDTPGIDERVGDEEAIDLAVGVIAQAQLVVHCIDPGDPLGELDPRIEQAIGAGVARLRVGTRGDLGEHAACVDLRVSIVDSIQDGGRLIGGNELVLMIRDRLVPGCVLADTRPWRFWDA